MLEAKTLIKICGITSIEQALQIAELGVDAIGVISVKESPRYVSPQKKEAIFKNLKKFYPQTKRVSVVKKLPLENFSENFISNENVIQLHGDEDLKYCETLRKKIPKIELWKAFRIRNVDDIKDIEYFLNFIDVILLDSWNKDTYGGSGIRIQKRYLDNLKFKNNWWLAGGISIDWVKNIIKDIKPNGIDISSSIEITPGVKDISKTKELIDAIRSIDPFLV